MKVRKSKTNYISQQRVKKGFFLLLILSNVLNTSLEAARILIVTGVFPPKMGTAVLNQIIGLKDYGHEVFIWANRKRKVARGYIESAYPEIKKYNLHKNIFFDKIATLSSTKIKFLKSFDIILCQFGNRGFQWVDLKKKFGLKAQLVTCFRGKDIGMLGQYNQENRSNLFKKTSLFLPVCDAFKRILLQYGCDKDKINTLYSAIDVNHFNLKSKFFDGTDSAKFISVCRLVDKKGLFDALKIFSIFLKKYHPDAHYYIVGEGPLMQSLVQYVADLDIERNVTFTGWLNRKEIVNFLHKSDIFLLPSFVTADGDTEGIPNAAKEAMACGLVTILTDVAGNKEMIKSGYNGYLVSVKDSLSVAELINDILENKEKIKEIGLQARQTIKEKFSKEKLASALHIIVNRLCNTLSETKHDL